ncbi:MAG: four helix bundle protein [Thermodesulfobacteriota bacterium]
MKKTEGREKLLRECCDYGMKDQMLRSSISIPSNILLKKL